MSSTFFRSILGFLFVLGLSFPAMVMADESADTEAEASAVQTYQADSTFSVPSVGDDAYNQGMTRGAAAPTILSYAILG
ncbi:MAG: hypothetical protein ACNA8W_20155, partial [Bradymonadaceae bacterium]